MALSECPICHTHINANPAWALEAHIICPECGSELVVVGLNPLELESASGEGNEEEENAQAG